MKNYELTIVLPGGTTAAKKKAAVASIKKIVKVLKGKLGKLADWGEIDLAYKIKGNSTGIFLHFPLELDPVSAKAIADKLRLEESLIRYLLIKKEERKSRKIK